MNLVACLSTGKGTWGHVAQLLNDPQWEKIFLITNEFGRENFKTEGKNAELIVIDANKPLEEMIVDVKEKLKGKIKDTEVAVNLISGSGKEHMAMLSALLQSGLGLRFFAVTKDGIKEV